MSSQIFFGHCGRVTANYVTELCMLSEFFHRLLNDYTEHSSNVDMSRMLKLLSLWWCSRHLTIIEDLFFLVVIIMTWACLQFWFGWVSHSCLDVDCDWDGSASTSSESTELYVCSASSYDIVANFEVTILFDQLQGPWNTQRLLMTSLIACSQF